MEFGLEIAKAIAELGILVVIAGVFIWFTIKSKTNQEEMFKKLFENLLNQMKLCAGGHVLTEEEDSRALQIDDNVNAVLQTAVSDLSANRIMVVRYHNGGKDMNAVPFLKFSVTNEQIARGSKPLMPLFQNQFRSLIAYPFREVDRTGKCMVPDLEALSEKDFGTYELFKNYDDRSFYAHALTTVNGYTMGVVVVFFENSNHAKENSEDIEHYMSVLAGQISALLTVKDSTAKEEKN